MFRAHFYAFLLLLAAPLARCQQAVVWQQAYNPDAPISTASGTAAISPGGEIFQAIETAGMYGYIEYRPDGTIRTRNISLRYDGLFDRIAYDQHAGILLWDWLESSNSHVIRFDPTTGRQRWEIQTGGMLSFLGFDPAGSFYFLENGIDGACLTKRRAEDGGIVWQVPVSNDSKVGTLDGHGNVYIFAGSILVKYSGVTGSESWTYDSSPAQVVAISVDDADNPTALLSDGGNTPALWLTKNSAQDGSRLFSGPKIRWAAGSNLKLINGGSKGFYGYGYYSYSFRNSPEFLVRFSGTDGSPIWTHIGTNTDSGLVAASLNLTGNLCVCYKEDDATVRTETYTPDGLLVEPGNNVPAPKTTNFALGPTGNWLVSGYVPGSVSKASVESIGANGVLQWADTYIQNGPEPTRAQALAIDDLSNCYAFAPIFGGGYRSGIVKYDRQGNQLWSVFDSLYPVRAAWGQDGIVSLGHDNKPGTVVTKRSPDDGDKMWFVRTEATSAQPSYLAIDHKGDIIAQIDVNKLAKFSGHDGSRLWTAQVSFPLLGPQGDIVAVIKDNSSRCYLARLRGSSGTVLWQTGQRPVGDGESKAIDPAGNVFMCYRNSDQQVVIEKVNGLTGSTVWLVQLPPEFISPVEIKCDLNGDLFLGGAGISKLNGIDGTWLWTAPNPNGDDHPIGHDIKGNVYVRSNSLPTRFYKLRGVDGTLVWSEIVTDFREAVVVSPSGRVYAGSDQTWPEAGFVSAITTVFDDPPTLDSLSVGPNPVNGGSPATGVVRLSAWARADTTVNLSSSDPCVIVPPTVVIAKGSPSTSFLIKTTNVYAETTATITATLNAVTRTATLTVRHISLLDTFTVTPSTVVGGNPVTGNVTLNLPAPAGGYVVAISSGSSVIQAPSSVTVPAGATTASFTINTKAVSQTVVRTVSASAEGVTNLVSITIAP